MAMCSSEKIVVMKANNLKIISRIKGGLGNQLFCYSAARRLALVTGAELVIDDVSGFARDHQFKRQYALGRFNIPCRKTTSIERLQPFDRYQRGVKKLIARHQPFEKRRYIEQEAIEFDERLLALKPQGTIYLDGLWQSEKYFKDVEKTIRSDLTITPPTDSVNQDVAKKIVNSNAVALHVRWFNAPGSTAEHNLSVDYYQRAISMINEQVSSPHYFLFSDNPQAAQSMLRLPKDSVTLVSHNQGDEMAYADMWLMAQCKYFITANSTFSWWAAWLGAYEDKVILSPNLNVTGLTAWGFKGLIPNDWIII